MAAPMRERFCEAISRILNSWTVLKLAVNHGFGGADSQAKADWMVYAIDQWFAENSNLETFEVEDFLEDVLSTEFDTIADDGSLPQIAKMICGFYRLCQEGNTAKIEEKLNELPKSAAVEKCKTVPVQNGAEGDDSDMEDDDNRLDTGPPGQNDTIQQQQQQSQSSVSDSTDCNEMDVTEEDDGWTTVPKKGKRR
ncbi:rRNA accumulation-related protein [Mactra antiquata]